MQITPEFVGYAGLALVLLVLAVVIVKRFGKLIVSVLTVIGALVVAAVAFGLLELLTGGLDLRAVKALFEVIR